MNDYWHMHREEKNWKTNMVIFLLVVIALFTGIDLQDAVRSGPVLDGPPDFVLRFLLR